MIRGSNDYSLLGGSLGYGGVTHGENIISLGVAFVGFTQISCISKSYQDITWILAIGRGYVTITGSYHAMLLVTIGIKQAHIDCTLKVSKYVLNSSQMVLC